MERIFRETDKIILDQRAQGSGIVPYLPLFGLPKAAGADAGGQ
jgi:hypothetical protein